MLILPLSPLLLFQTVLLLFTHVFFFKYHCFLPGSMWNPTASVPVKAGTGRITCHMLFWWNCIESLMSTGDCSSESCFNPLLLISLLLVEQSEGKCCSLSFYWNRDLCVCLCAGVCVCLYRLRERDKESESDPVIWSGVVPYVIRKPGVTVGHEFSISSQILQAHLHNTDTATRCDHHKHSCCVLLLSAGTLENKTAATDNRSHIKEELPVNQHLLSAEEAQLLCVCTCVFMYCPIRLRNMPFRSQLDHFLTLNWISCEWRERQRNIDSFSERRERATPFQ